jgi:exosortase/archaeosortase family protein
MAAHTDMTFEQRQVAHHTAFALNLFGTDAVAYDYVVRVPDLNPQQKEIVGRLYTYDFVKEPYQNGMKLKAVRLPLEQEGIVDSYIASLQQQGLPVYVSKAVVGSKSAAFEVVIIPECVGWVGIFAITALIFAYPAATLRQRGLGLLMAWPIMYVINVLRLSTSIYIAYIGGNNKFEFAHDILWSGIFIGFALILWLSWVHFFARGKEPRMIVRQLRRKLL